MATIKDVARLSGVSKTTVSVVLSGGPRAVLAETRKRVLEAAEQLEYRPNALARGLVGKRMNTLGVVFSQWNSPQVDPFVLNALLGVLSLQSPVRQNVMLFDLDYWERGIERLSELCDGRCDGLILMVPPEDNDLPAALMRRKVPCVLLEAQEPTQQAPSVAIDNFRAAFEMTNALLEMGHRRIAYVSAVWVQESVSGFFRERHDGYRAAMKNAGVYSESLAEIKEAEGAVASLRAPLAPTAFFCHDDHLALLVLEALSVCVPQEVSVVGCGDIPGASHSKPPLSTMRQPSQRLGQRAAELLLSLIEGTTAAGHRELFAAEMVLRESTAPPRKAAS